MSIVGNVHENIFTQSAFTPAVWELACQVIEKYEKGQERLNKKALLVTSDFKQHYFQCLHNLHPSFQEEVLEEVVNRKVTLELLEEMKTKAQNLRNMHKIRTAFAKFTACSWEEAAKQYHLHTTEERLSTFFSLDFTKGLSAVLQSCHA